MAFRVDRQASPGGIEMSVFANASKDVERFAAERSGVVHSVGREEWEPMLFRKLDELAIDAFFAPNEMALEFDINTIATKDVE